ncbi:MAG TPA: hypothetical protein VFK04_07005 [Gemmatimonadaceae bacterium]|jgi:uncharacterized protein YlxW (UPF0749 family)|nr:hypothetical protein [Gemmatimonadaceae bacterium]
MGDVLQFVAVISSIAIVCVGSYASIKATNRIWGKDKHATPRELDELRQRLEQLQQSMDSVAVEVERISEGQRFTTKLLAERSDAEPLHVAAKSSSR